MFLPSPGSPLLLHHYLLSLTELLILQDMTPPYVGHHPPM